MRSRPNENINHRHASERIIERLIDLSATFDACDRVSSKSRANTTYIGGKLRDHIYSAVLGRGRLEVNCSVRGHGRGYHEQLRDLKRTVLTNPEYDGDDLADAMAQLEEFERTMKGKRPKSPKYTFVFDVNSGVKFKDVYDQLPEWMFVDMYVKVLPEFCDELFDTLSSSRGMLSKTEVYENMVHTLDKTESLIDTLNSTGIPLLKSQGCLITK